jgi:hypothetical protein
VFTVESVCAAATMLTASSQRHAMSETLDVGSSIVDFDKMLSLLA